jgi:DNA repair exonuclease SbcCD ATPase subunit
LKKEKTMGLFDFLKRKELDEIKLLKSRLEKYKPILNIDLETENKTNEFNELTENQKIQAKKSENELIELNSKYSNSLETYKKLRKEVSIYESKLDLIEFGVYEPIYDFEKSEDYRTEQKKVIGLQKEMITYETAATCSTNWTVDGSEAKGKASTKRNIKLVLRAFNGECNSLIAKVKWNNVNQMKERIKKSFEAINKLGKSSTISISNDYLKLKVKELTLEHEFQLKKQNEREELRAIKEEIREEERAKREFEKAQRDAEKEEKNYQTALEKARKEIEELTGEKQGKLQEKIEKLELELKEAQERKERAISMAQQTKRGHVYIISNIGSFGENIYKIGMTRRLEPTDRVKELGDASVPFKFDIHAMIYSEEAPILEKELHRKFEEKKVNMLNYR